MRKVIFTIVMLVTANAGATTTITLKPYESEALQGCSYTVKRDGRFVSSEYAPYSCGKAVATIRSLYEQFVPGEHVVFKQNGVNL